MATFRVVYECYFLDFDLVILTTGSSAILVLNWRMATKFDPPTILQISVKNS